MSIHSIMSKLAKCGWDYAIYILMFPWPFYSVLFFFICTTLWPETLVAPWLLQLLQCPHSDALRVNKSPLCSVAMGTDLPCTFIFIFLISFEAERVSVLSEWQWWTASSVYSKDLWQVFHWRRVRFTDLVGESRPKRTISLAGVSASDFHKNK